MSAKRKTANTIIIVPKRQQEHTHTHTKPVRNLGAFYTHDVEEYVL